MANNPMPYLYDPVQSIFSDYTIKNNQFYATYLVTYESFQKSMLAYDDFTKKEIHNLWHNYRKDFYPDLRDLSLTKEQLEEDLGYNFSEVYLTDAKREEQQVTFIFKCIRK